MHRPWWLVLPVALAIVALQTGAWPAKIGVALSCALLLAWALSARWTLPRGAPWLIGALLLSAVGDLFLSFKAGRVSYFIAGIAFFFGAHLGYLAYALAHGRIHRTVLAAMVAVFLPYYVFALHPAMAGPALSVAVLGYLLISCVVFAAACGMRLGGAVKWPFLAGIGLIVLSDTIISFKEFLHWHAWNGLILPTYYLAQISVTAGALARPPRPPA